MKFPVLLLATQLGISTSFAPARLLQNVGSKNGKVVQFLSAESSEESWSISSQTQEVTSDDNTNTDTVEYENWDDWVASTNDIVVSPKLTVQSPTPEERGKGGVTANESISALDVLARIPRKYILATSDAPVRAIEAASKATEFSWSTDLTATALAALYPSEDELEDADAVLAKQQWIQSWKSGGWGTDGADLGPPEADWGVKCVTGSLLATGSDNDHNIYAKFRFPCHPVVHRAGLGLAVLTGCDGEESLEALVCRGRTFRSMRDALVPLVTTPSDRRKGSLRERKTWDIADVLSRILSRAVKLEGDDEDSSSTYAVVPLHERLAHCDDRGENAKLVTTDDDEILLVATRDIAVGEAITRDYKAAPQLEKDTSEGALRLLLQFGLPPNAF